MINFVAGLVAGFIIGAMFMFVNAPILAKHIYKKRMKKYGLTDVDFLKILHKTLEDEEAKK